MARINANKSVMHRFAPSSKFKPPDVAFLSRRHGNYKIAVNVLPLRGHGVALRHLHYQIRSPQFPILGPLWKRREVRGISFGRAFRSPLTEQPYLVHGELAAFTQCLVTGLGQPRRHNLFSCDLSDLLAVPSNFLPGDKIARGRLTRPMTPRALFIDY